MVQVMEGIISSSGFVYFLLISKTFFYFLNLLGINFFFFYFEPGGSGGGGGGGGGDPGGGEFEGEGGGRGMFQVMVNLKVFASVSIKISSPKNLYFSLLNFVVLDGE